MIFPCFQITQVLPLMPKVNVSFMGRLYKTFFNFQFTVSDLKNRYVSNILQTELTTDQSTPQYDMQALGRREKESLPGAVEEESVKKSSGISFGVMIGIIVAASCLFVFLVFVVVLRLQRYGNK